MEKALRRMSIAMAFAIVAVGLAITGVAQDAAETNPVPAVDQPQPAAKRFVDFARDIAPILEARCASCHEGEGAKNGFLVGDRDAVLGFVQAGSSSDSSLWTDYLMPQKVDVTQPSLLMPPDGPLPKGELALLKLWIDEGADWPEGAKLAGSIAAAPVGELSANARAFRAIGYFHPAIVHFPIALLTIAAVSVALSYVLGAGYARFGYACLALGAWFSIVSVVMGWSFAETRGFGAWSQMLASGASEEESNQFFHRWLGTATAIGAVLVMIAGWRAKREDGSRPGHLWRIGTLLLFVLVGIVGHQGGELVYGDIFAKALEQLQGPK
jgi:uncharacterized membrane protein